MLSPKFRLYLVVLVIVCLSGAGLYVYHNHVGFQGFMEEHSHKMAQLNKEMQPNLTAHVNSATDQQLHSSDQEPVKVKYARIGKPSDEGVTTVMHDPPIPIPKETLVPQEIETPDGQVHKILWYRKLRPGDSIPPLDSLPMDKVIVGGMMFNLPSGETADWYIEKIKLSTIYDVPLESVDGLIEEGVIPASLEEAADDPIFDDPLFVKREDSRPVEASAPWDPAEWGYSDYEIKLMTEGIPVSQTETRMIEGEMMLVDVKTGYVLGPSDESDETSGEINTTSDVANPNSSGFADDFDDVLADALEKPKLPQSMVAPDKQAIPPTTEAALTEGLPLEGIDKAQTRINQHSTEERRRHLEKVWGSARDAAQQFDRERLRSESPQPSEPSGDVPDGEESER